jgi:hypothetical protein
MEKSGAGNETRTRDPDLGKVVLYQLSYSRLEARHSSVEPAATANGPGPAPSAAAFSQMEPRGGTDVRAECVGEVPQREPRFGGRARRDAIARDQ